jgi:hypothetical protein
LLNPLTLFINYTEHVQTKGLVQLLGQSIASHGVYVGCLVAGYAPTRALGVTAATYAASELWTVATRGHEDLGLPQDLFIGYAVVLAGIAAKLLTSDAIEIEE